MKKIILPALLGVLLFTSCKKEEPTPTPAPTPAPTKTEMLTGKNWKMTALTINPGVDFGNGVIITDFYSQIPSCTQDDLTKFNTDGTLVFDEGATKCDAANPQTNTGTWSFNSAETILTINTSDGPESYTIESISATSIKLIMIVNENGVDYTYKITFTKQ